MKALEPKLKTKDQDVPVIVVEDEETVLSFLENSLRTSGYRNVYSCEDRAAALRRVDELPEGPIALIIDVALRTDNGIELAKLLLEQRPGSRVLLISGFIDEMVLPASGLEPRHVSFLAKPFNFRQFTTEFERLLGA